MQSKSRRQKYSQTGNQKQSRIANRWLESFTVRLARPIIMGAESSIEIDRDQADMQDTEGQSGDEILNEEMNQGNADTQEKDTAYFAQALASRKRKRRQDESDETCVGLICSLNPNTTAIECVLTFLLLYRHLLYRRLFYCHLLYRHLLYLHLVYCH